MLSKTRKFCYILFIYLLLYGLPACGLFSQPVKEISELGKDEVDRIEIYRYAANGKSYPIKLIDNSEQIEVIKRYIATFSDHWYFEYPYPRSDTYVRFFNKNELKTSIMIGTPTSQENLTKKYFLGFHSGPTRFIAEDEFNTLTELLLID